MTTWTRDTITQALRAWIDEDGTIAFADVTWPFPVECVGAAMRALRASTGALMREVPA